MKIEVETTVQADLQSVWRAYNDPEDIKRWNAASDDWHTTESEVQLEVGGRFRSRMEAKDGSMGFDFAGTYTQVEPERFIRCELEDAREFEVRFSSNGSGVSVRVIFDGEEQTPADLQRDGWQAILDRFKAHVEAKAGSSTVSTCLWFNGQAQAAAELYTSLLPNSSVDGMLGGKDGSAPMAVNFRLAGVPYQALNGGPMYEPSPFASIVVHTADQAETDRLWEALTADGGSPSRCGWLVDRFGVSWQIVPRPALSCLSSPDAEASGRAMRALMEMNKIDIPTIEAAFKDG